MDIQIPIMDGWEATKVICKRPRVDANLPILQCLQMHFWKTRGGYLRVE